MAVPNTVNCCLLEFELAPCREGPGYLRDLGVRKMTVGKGTC